MARFDPALGAKIRAVRTAKKMAQAELAQRIGISPSYLNLIEHGKRALPAHLFVQVVKELEVDIDAFSNVSAHTDTQLMEVFSDSIFDGEPVTEDEIRALVAHVPNVAGAVLTLYENYVQSRETAHSLASKVATGQELGDEPSNVTSWRLPSEEVSDFLQRNMNYFSDLEYEAERVRKAANVTAYPGRYQAMVAWLADRNVDVSLVPSDKLDRIVRRYDPEARRILLSENLQPHSLTFQLAHQVALLHLGDLLDELVSDPKLTTDDSRKLGRVALSNYFAGAIMMPYDRFLQSAVDLRYDVDSLASRFRSSFEQVCHRLTNLQKPGSSGVPFHFLRVDIAGNISKRFSASGIQFARFSGACPRWNLVRCFSTPGRISRQVSKMTDGKKYFCIARTSERGDRSFGSMSTLHAICLGCQIEHARELVYADGIDIDNDDAATPVGVTCRLCDRLDCEQRAFPPVHRSLHIDENVRGYSFYASVK